jgi:hypothetical protein
MSATETSVTEFKELCEECLDLLTVLRVDLPDDFSEFASEDIKTYCKLMPAAVEATQLPVKDINEKKSLLSKLTTYIGYVKTLKDAFSKIAKATILDSGTHQDWKTKYANAQNKETVIEEFIYTTWPEHAQEVIKIKAALLQECEHYGFLTTGERLNPFITFISTVYLKNEYKVKPESYNVIHNLVASGSLTGKDLASKGEMGHGNLVFCKALYSLELGAMKLYIKKQHSLLKAAKKPDTFESNAEMAFNILYKVPTVAQGKDTRNSTEMQLRSIAEIEQLEEKWIGEVSSTAEEPKNKVAINAELIKQIDTTEEAINVLVAMAIKFSTSDEITKAVNSCTESKQRMSKASTIAETQALVAKVERLYKLTAINASQALKLVKSILESDKFNLTKE